MLSAIRRPFMNNEEASSDNDETESEQYHCLVVHFTVTLYSNVE